MTQILDEVLGRIPDSGKNVSDACFEGANIILYTKNSDFFLNQNTIIKDIVNIIKKRIELRPDPSICMEIEKAKEAIERIVPKEAGLSNVKFDPQRSIVIIEAEKPGIAIGKQGEVLKEIKRRTLWVPTVERMPPLKSQIIENIRSVLFENNDYRKKFLSKVGHRVYDGWKREIKSDWVRVTMLGAGRQVGRSCILLQTPESRILLDCGIDVSASDHNTYPILDCPEFKIEELDAIVLSHAHMDHSGAIPFLYRMGYRGPVYCTAPTRDVAALLALDYIGVSFKQAKKMPFDIENVKEMVKHTITLDWEEVTDITPDVRLTLYNSGHVLGSSMSHLHIGNALHNLLYSLDWKTPVVVLDEGENATFNPIGQLIDELFEEFPSLINTKSGFEELDNVRGLKTVVFNPVTYKTEIKTITSFIRHPVSEDLYEVTTGTGRSAVVTKSHSVFSVINGQVQAIKVSDLQVEDFIIGPKVIPNSKKIPSLNLRKHSRHLRIRIEDETVLKDILSEHERNLTILRERDRVHARQWLLEHYKNGMYKNDIAKKYHVRTSRIQRVFKTLGVTDHPRVKHSLPDTFTITPDFARFIGYYVAEGSLRKNSQTISIVNYSKQMLDDCKEIIERSFGISCDVRYDDNVILIHSKQIKYLLSQVLLCGENAYTKRAPKEILFAHRDIVKNFLYGYFSGDGGISIRPDGREIMAASKNPHLIDDIVFMLLQFGIVPTLQYNATTRMHIATVYNAERIQAFLEEIGMMNASTIALTSIVKMIKRKAGFDKRIPLLALSKKAQLMLTRSPYRKAKTCGIDVLQDMFQINEDIVHSDFMFDHIVSIKKVKPTSRYVYDFKVEGYENFLGGRGFLFFHNTGDYKFIKTRLSEPAATNFPRLETVITEATYGGKDDVLCPRLDAEAEMMRIIKTTVERGGKVLIPVLGVGRAQEIMLIVEEAIRTNKIPKFPVYVQGMVWDVTAIHTAYPDFLNNALKKEIFHKDQNPFLSDIFTKITSKKEQDKIIEESGPGIIIATAGMLNAGASLEYFKRMADDPKHSMIFVTYQGEGTIGRRVQRGEKEIQLTLGDRPEIIKIKMDIYSVTSLSGHAGRNELLRFIQSLNPKPKRVITNHGEASKCVDLASTIHKFNHIETMAPKNLETIRLR